MYWMFHLDRLYVPTYIKEAIKTISWPLSLKGKNPSPKKESNVIRPLIIYTCFQGAGRDIRASLYLFDRFKNFNYC